MVMSVVGRCAGGRGSASPGPIQLRGSADAAHRVQIRPAFSLIADPDESDGHDRSSIAGQRVSGQGRLPGSVGKQVAPAPHGLDGIGRVEGQLDDQGLIGDRVEPKLELGDDPEVAAPAAEAPEQVVMLGAGGLDDVAVGGHDLEALDVVTGEPAAAAPAIPSRRQASGHRPRCARRCRRSWPGHAQATPGRGSGAARRPGPGRVAARHRPRHAFIGVRSIISPPSGTESPSTLCPPHFTPMSRSCWRAKRIAAATSAALDAWAMSAGRWSTIAFHTSRWVSYPSSDGPITAPAKPGMPAASAMVVSACQLIHRVAEDRDGRVQ